jgi:hypothetical protein
LLAWSLRKRNSWPVPSICRPTQRGFATLITTEFCQTSNHLNRNGMYRRNGGAIEVLHLA